MVFMEKRRLATQVNTSQPFTLGPSASLHTFNARRSLPRSFRRPPRKLKAREEMHPTFTSVGKWNIRMFDSKVKQVEQVAKNKERKRLS